MNSVKGELERKFIHRLFQKERPAIAKLPRSSSQDMDIEFNDSEDQFSFLKRYVVDQGAEILLHKRKLNYVLKFIGVTQDVDEFDVDQNYSHISVADKWCQQKSDRRDKVKSSIRTPSASVVNQSDKVVAGGSGVSHSASGTTPTSAVLT